VFSDLALPDPEELLYKSKLVVAIEDTMKELGLNQSEVARITGVSQPDLSKLLRGRTTSFTVDRLYQLLTQLGADIEITVVRRRHPTLERGQVHVREALLV
jgi:predicted XRE-type DNA-binding protein